MRRRPEADPFIFHAFTDLIGAQTAHVEPAGLTREEFTAKVQGHVKGTSGWLGRFKHQ